MAKAGFMVITGAASGIMEAGHRGAGREARGGAGTRQQQPDQAVRGRS
jgi:predicted Rossmann-fold nucleotide-binding protein